jgi:uncharacterized membrane protein YfhO
MLLCINLFELVAYLLSSFIVPALFVGGIVGIPLAVYLKAWWRTRRTNRA